MKNKFSYKLFRRIVFLVLFAFILSVALFFFLVTVIVQSEIFNISTLTQENILMIVCIIICILLVSQAIMLYWSKKVIKPIKTISDSLEQISKGNFDVKIDTSGFTDEFKLLGNSLNTMIDELKSIEVMRNDFVSNVSHEFKAPLSAIQGYVTLLSNPTLKQEKYKEYFGLLTDSTRQLSGLVENVLKLSKLESQTIISNRHKFSLDEQLRQVVIMFEQQWSQKNIELELDLPETNYYGNEDLLKQMWINLFGNSIKYTNDNGKIGLRIEKDAQNNLLVTIYDNGIGISKDAQKHIFEKFYQSDTSRRSQGNGLGLALVKTICDLTQSKISVESEIDKGTSFTVKLADYNIIEENQ